MNPRRFINFLTLWAGSTVLLLSLLSCSMLDTESEPRTPSPDRNQTLTFTAVGGSKAQQIAFTDPEIFPAPLFGIALEDCSGSIDSETENNSLNGKARQLFVSLDELSILERRTLEAETEIVSIHATATVEDTPLALVAYTWNINECLHDFLVWSKDASLVSSEESSERIALAILDRYVIATVQSFTS